MPLKLSIFLAALVTACGAPYQPCQTVRDCDPESPTCASPLWCTTGW